MVSVKEKTISGRQYLYANYSFRLPDGSIKKVSKLVKSKEEAGAKTVKDYFLRKEVEAYQAYALKHYTPDRILTKEKIQSIEAMKAEYRQLIRNLSKQQLKDILDRFTVNFTYESNAIEGNSLTLKDVTLILHENVVPKGKELREVYETRNTRVANQLLFDNKIRITVKNVVKLHEVLVKDTGVAAGFKKFPNFLLMRDVKTTPPEKVRGEMERLVQWYQENKAMHPLVLASEFHARFERIHPFEDGNGRAGRVLVNAILLENGYPPLIIRKTMRQSYFAALEAADKKYFDKLTRFLLEKLEHTFKNFFKMYVKYL